MDSLRRTLPNYGQSLNILYYWTVTVEFYLIMSMCLSYLILCFFFHFFFFLGKKEEECSVWHYRWPLFILLYLEVRGLIDYCVSVLNI